MKLVATLFSALAAVLSVQAITVSVDRADIKQVSIPQPTQSQSMFLNGWRPLNTNYNNDNIGINVSPLNNFDRSLTPLHTVLGKLQEQITASNRVKPHRQEKPHQIEYNPTNLLGSFAVFSHVLPKQRIEKPPSADPKTLSTEREYTFLVPPVRDTLRYEVEPQKKAPVRDNEPYVRSSQFMPQVMKPDSRSPTYYIKPASFSTNLHPFSQGRPFVNSYSAQQSLIPSRFPSKQYEELKSSNEKPYFQSSKISNGFNKDNKVNADQAFDHFQPQQASQQINNNFYNQINHAAHYKQASFERDPSFLVHESHEVSYVTPSSSYKYRPLSYHFDNSVQDAYTSSTAPSRIELNKFTQHQTPSNMHSVGFKQFQTSPKIADKHHQEPHGLSNTYYITDFQKTRYTPDINEVLPKTNQPAKFNQISTTTIPYVPDHRSKVVYVRPELQQQQYQSSIIPININQRPPEVEYETPESISLKHFNEQQFLLQQQLIQQDRQRLREQEKRRQQELQRQQQEELDRRQHEIKLLEQRQKEKEQLEQLQTVEPDIIKEVPLKHHFIHHYPIEEQKIIPKEQYKFVYHQYEPPQSSSEMPVQLNNEKNSFKQVTVQKFEEIVTPAATEATTQEEFQPVIRPYRPQKPFREQVRRRKPTTLIYDPVPTELPVYYSSETSESLTDIPIQTTSPPETTTVQVTERTVRTRRPGGSLRRRRPSTTTTTNEPIEYEEEAIRYNTPEVQDFEKKRRVRPIGNNYQDNSSERRPLRKRPGHRVKLYNKERDNIDIIPERIKTTEKSLREISPTENYPEAFLKELYSSEYLSSSDKSLTDTNHQEVRTELVPIEYFSETTAPPVVEYYEPTRNDHNVEQYTQKVEDNGPLEHLFTKTEVNHVESTSASSPSTYSTASTTSTTSEAPITTKTIIASPKTTHRMRPTRYGNATRPRFSIKDYKSRLDYKNRLSQSSSTEASTATASPKLRSNKNQQNPADPGFKEASGRYKYNQRSSYRTSTSSSASSQSDDNNGATTDRNIRYPAKKRINPNYYRNRVANPNKQDQEHASSQSTTRPDNPFSSQIRKRPGLKNRSQSLPTPDRINKLAVPESTEMQSAAETGFFATTNPISNPTEAVNEIAESKDTLHQEVRKPVDEAQDEKSLGDLSDVTIDENEAADKGSSGTLQDSSPIIRKEVNVEYQVTIATTPDTTTAFDIRHEEELFAKASQSVADLTSSASALYDKPGMFKAVSPGNENRSISPHLKIATDEPTLPIEAFFQDISKKN